METRPVVLTQQVCLHYQSQEVQQLIKAANQLPPYEIQEFSRYIRIDNFSLIGRGWRCAFIIFKPTETNPNWILDTVEYLPAMSDHQALASLGHLETFGLNRLKFGL